MVCSKHISDLSIKQLMLWTNSKILLLSPVIHYLQYLLVWTRKSNRYDAEKFHQEDFI